MSSVPRGKLLGMQVYNPDGSLIGVVQDIELPIGEGEISLQVMSKYNLLERIPWSMVAAAGDIVILKEKMTLKQPETLQPQTYAPPTVQPAQPQQRGGIVTGVISRLPFGRKEKNPCPTCGKELSWIEQYQRWYCYNCGKYV
ncbi:MAG: PRC-barrel domain-containing protein [Candidatus Caldarchaeum sp.]|nr:PRC-barrel domain-containing protein [Candidatus Caldarchaeum sp.]